MMAVLRAQPGRLWRLLGVFQKPGVRLVHALTASFVLLQFLSSYPMAIGADKASFGGWYHMWGGITLCFLAVLQTAFSLKTRGLRHFFPYLWGDVEHLKLDIRQTLHFKLVPPRPGGLGAVVQGLGLGALLLTAFSGLLWFWLWQGGSPGEPAARSFHDAVSWLIILYFIGHGGMALLHFYSWEEKVPQKDDMELGLCDLKK